MKQISLEEMSHINGGKFFGPETHASECKNGVRVVSRDYYVLWVKFHQSTMVEACQT